MQAGGAGVTHEPQAHPPRGTGWPWCPQEDRASRQGPRGPAASRGEPRLGAHRKLIAPLLAKLESLHFSEEQTEASESGNPFPAWPIKPRSEMRARCGLTQNQSHQIWTVSPLSGQCRPGRGGPPYHRKLGFLTSPDGS